MEQTKTEGHTAGETDTTHNGRFCVNCRWCEEIVRGCFRCVAPQNFIEQLSPVTGETKRTVRLLQYCEPLRMHRARGENCGIEGTWFEPREELVPVVEFTEAAE